MSKCSIHGKDVPLAKGSCLLCLCDEQQESIIELEQQLDRYTRISESGMSLGDSIDNKIALEDANELLDECEEYIRWHHENGIPTVRGDLLIAKLRER